MARTFGGSTAHQLSAAASPFTTGGPLTMACWFRGNPANSVGQGLMTLDGGAGASAVYRLTYQSNVAGDPLRAQTLNGASSSFCDTSTGVTDNDWHHAAGAWSSTNQPRVWLNGGSKGSSATTLAFPSPTVIRLGAWANAGSVIQPLDGALAWPSIWNVELSDAEIAALAAGAHPLTIRPANIVAFWPLTGSSDAGEVDIVGGYDLSETGTVGTAESPLVAIDGPIFSIYTPTAGGGATIPIFHRHYARMKAA